MKLLQIHLKAPNMSQRGVRLRLLSYPVVQQCQNDAAKLVGPDAGFAAFRNAYHSEALRRFVAEVSEPAGTLTEDTPWRALTVADLTTPGGAYQLESMFSAREIAVLESLFRQHHEVTQDELDMITGKASPVA